MPSILSFMTSYFRQVVDIYLVLLGLFIGGFLLIFDVAMLHQKKLEKEATIAKTLGYVYILTTITLFITRKMV